MIKVYRKTATFNAVALLMRSIGRHCCLLLSR